MRGGVACVLVVLGCSAGELAPAPNDDGSVGDGAPDVEQDVAVDTARPPVDAPSDTPPIDAGPPTFEKDVVPIFESSCGASNNDCHSRVAYHPKPENGCRGWLALENASIGSVIYAGADKGKATGCPDMPLYDRLTKLDAWECGPPFFPAFPKKKYVEPGDPAKSHLFNKVSGGPQCGVPNPMPKEGTMPSARIETLRQWILAGAPRAK